MVVVRKDEYERLEEILYGKDLVKFKKKKLSTETILERQKKEALTLTIFYKNMLGWCAFSYVNRTRAWGIDDYICSFSFIALKYSF